MSSMAPMLHLSFGSWSGRRWIWGARFASRGSGGLVYAATRSRINTPPPWMGSVTSSALMHAQKVA